METTRIKQAQIPRNFEWPSGYDGIISRMRKVKRSPAQIFLFWSAVIITIGIVSARLALLVV